MTARLGTRLAIQINDGPALPGTLSIDSNNEVVWLESARPDPDWTGTDSNGHFHARSDDGTYPTLVTRAEHVDCDGSCGGVCDGEGYTVFHYDCAVCGEEVQPGTIPGPHQTVIPGLQSWSVTVVTGTPIGNISDRVTVRVAQATPGILYFGVAQVVDVQSQLDLGAMERHETTLAGVSALGETDGR